MKLNKVTSIFICMFAISSLQSMDINFNFDNKETINSRSGTPQDAKINTDTQKKPTPKIPQIKIQGIEKKKHESKLDETVSAVTAQLKKLSVKPSPDTLKLIYTCTNCNAAFTSVICYNGHMMLQSCKK